MFTASGTWTVANNSRFLIRIRTGYGTENMTRLRRFAIGVIKSKALGTRRSPTRLSKSAMLYLNTVWEASAMPRPKYEVIIYWSEEDQAFIAEVPELAGCAADGKTHREALANVEVVIKKWIETAAELGRPIPQPKGRLVFA